MAEGYNHFLLTVCEMSSPSRQLRVVPADRSPVEAGISWGAHSHSWGPPRDDSPEQHSPARGLPM